MQTCIIHLIRNTFRLASRKDHDAIKRDIKPVYTAVNAAAARAAMDQVAETWKATVPGRHPAVGGAWEQFIPFLDYDLEIRRVICSTNAIESLNARYRRAVKARGHFPRAGRPQIHRPSSGDLPIRRCMAPRGCARVCLADGTSVVKARTSKRLR